MYILELICTRRHLKCTSARTVSNHPLPHTLLTGQVPGVLTGLTANHSRVAVTSEPRMPRRADVLAPSN